MGDKNKAKNFQGPKLRLPIFKKIKNIFKPIKENSSIRQGFID